MVTSNPRLIIPCLLNSLKGITTVIVYVDDIVIIGDDSEEVNKLKSHLSSGFELKDLGILRCFLGIEVAHSKRGIFVSQRKYVLDILTETGLLGAKPADTPIEGNHGLNDQDGKSLIDVGAISTTCWEIDSSHTHKTRYCLCSWGC